VSSVAERVGAVVVDFHAESALAQCVDSLRSDGVEDIVVVENGTPGSTPSALSGRGVRIIEPGLNLGYGRGANRGVATLSNHDLIVVSNPDVVVHYGALDALVAALDAQPRVAIVGPQIRRPDGSVYPSHRVFPNFWLAGVHALLAPLWPSNPATRRYRSRHDDGSVDWVSGAFFMMRREAFEEVGGFDERYFMFAEDMTLCWDVRQRGWGVAAVDDAVVTHVEGLSRQRATRSMLWAHHRSALRFEAHTATGLRRALLPLATVVLGVRLVVVAVLHPRGS
jgi:N-acetylglucosaminyl-diphospho-decaprenol L-rhamnosyltransferase